MAGEKLSNRQKMISMMYLVLTALLALNVSKDILDAFVVVNDGLEANIASTEIKNKVVYAQLELADKVNPMKARPFWEKAQDVQATTKELYDFIEGIKWELIQESEDVTQEIAAGMSLASVEKKDNYDIPTHIMIGSSEDGSKGRAGELKRHIEQLREHILEIVGDTPEERANIGLLTEEFKSLEGNLTWEVHNFDHTPMAAAVTILSQLQSEVRNAEYYAINHLNNEVDGETIPVDAVAARVMSRTNYVLLGEDYEADIFLGAYSSTAQPDMRIGTLDEGGENLARTTDSLVVENGMGKYRVKADREGVFTYEGTVDYTMPSGEVRHYPFKSEYIVARPNVVVSPTQLNLVYKGISNPLSISVPGIPAENIVASITGGNSLRKLSNGSYEANIVNGSPWEVEVLVSARTETGTKPMGKMKFKVKALPRPYARIAKILSSGRMSGNDLKIQKLIAEYSRDFPFLLSARVIYFKMGVKLPNGNYIEKESHSNKLTPDMVTIIGKLRPGTKVFFDDIKAKGSDDVKHELGNIKVVISR